MIPKDRVIDQLNELGLKNLNDAFYNLSTGQLYERAIYRREGVLSHYGPIVVRTGQHTGRSPNDKFIVKEATSEKFVNWGKINTSIDEKKFDQIFEKMKIYIQNKDVFVQDCYAGADPQYKLRLRVITETAWHNVFARNLFRRIASKEELAKHVPDFTIIDMPNFHANPATDGTNSEVFVIINFAKKLVLIGGTHYAGEIKKSAFTVLNYLLPLKGVMSMHCSANIGKEDDSAVLFGLSGTGKTTLSADPKRRLIGDDEHGWSDNGIFNYEGGCYAKVIRLSEEAEPDIFKTTRTFGTVLENVKIDADTRLLDLDDDTLTENTRAAYPITFIENIEPTGQGGHPRNIIMLTADAFGVLPPVAKLTNQQAMYHFLSGYTAKVAGTEKGITEPKATFSTCFGAPFMVLNPSVYADLLGKKIKEHNVNCWLLNTGWTGGPYGVGKRMKIAYTRAMLDAILSGELAKVETKEDPYFGLNVPVSCPNVPQEVLDPRNTWQSKEEYDKTAVKLANMFHENFKQFEKNVEADVINAGPKALTNA
ncbi:MAG: phosphoenolpyruvate carboxykinase [Bacteroidota bacterium]|nr:phosphoenolpyruvate carboxykinase [Bacteroidota bacterium]MDP4196255.1 phosphoenolpyruvate carboxykinase [Bacteroidota bacterium]